MIPIQNFETDGRQCKRDGCAEIMCAQNPRAVIGKTYPGRFGVPADRCPDILAQIANDETDVVLRYWMEKAFIEKKCLPTPTQLRELLQREGIHDAMPVSTVQAFLDALEWPSDVLDERRKKALSDFRRQFLEHGSGAEQISFERWASKTHNV